MVPTQRNHEFVNYLHAQSAYLGKPQVMRVPRLASCPRERDPTPHINEPFRRRSPIVSVRLSILTGAALI